MSPGRRPIASFIDRESHVNELATNAGNHGAYTVESLIPGLCYIVYADRVSIATNKGSMTVSVKTAKTIAEEIVDILEDVEQNVRDGITPMDSRSIGKMLEGDYR